MDDAAVILLDREAIIRYWSPAAESLFGHAAPRVLGTPLEALLPPAYQERHRKGFAAAVARGDTKLYPVDGETGDGDLVIG